MSYKNLEIWQLAREIALEVHKMTLEDLPKFEMYETGQQIPLTQIVGLNTTAAGTCKYATGNYLQIYQDVRKLPVQFAKSRLFNFSVVTTTYPLTGVVRTNVP